MGRTEGGDRAQLTRIRAAIGFTAAATALADLLLPLICVVCERTIGRNERGIVCGHCWSRVRELPNPRCRRCGHPSGRHACRWCDQLPVFVRAARSFCWMGAGIGEQIVYALKYDGWERVAKDMADRMARADWPLDVIEERAAIVPVPLSQRRRRERGFNQSVLLAESLGSHWQTPVWDDVLLRASGTTSQTRLTPLERQSNVAGAFVVPASARARLSGSHVVIVDDVVTTGATLRACASALFAAGTRTVSFMTFGRAPSSSDRLYP